MILLLILLILISIYGINFKSINTIDSDALSKNRTTMINGVFVLLVLISHFNSYVLEYQETNRLYFTFFNLIGQLMVTTFLFYSGYGVLESIKNKKNYMDTFFENRILKLFIRFSIAILFFLFLDICINEPYSLKTILLSFIGYEAVGNSNWFIFAIFCMYFITLFAFKICKNILKSINIVTMLSFVYILFIVVMNKDNHWCNTILCYSIGMYFSYYKDKILLFLKDNKKYYLTLFIIMVSFIFLYLISRMLYYRIINLILYNLISILFVLMILFLSFKVYIGNKILYFLGKNTFNIYILQRISYILFKEVGLNEVNVYLYFTVSIIFTLLLSIIFDKIVNTAYKYLLKEKA